MSLHYYDNSLIPAPTLGFGAALNPSIYRPTLFPPRDFLRPHDIRSLRQYYDADEKATPREKLENLKDPNLDYNGDLGWTLEYATAYCYKHLLANRPGIVAAIDTARKAPVHKKTPYMIFDLLDKALFTNKLQSMVYLKWKTQELHSPGQTCAADEKMKRISIELNSTPFEDSGDYIDELLDVLIHQMIHAYFLVCCGKQKDGAEEDGRLLDGLHFGVIMLTVRDITEDCRAGKLDLIFHAALRHDNLANSFIRHGNNMRMKRKKDAFITIDPKGSTLGPPPVDGHSHCTHDNRRFRYSQIRNWQVEEYARCIDLELDNKGLTIYDLDVNSELKEHTRLHGPPSNEYIELIWDGKRIMVPRNKVLAIPSLKKPAMKEDRHEIKIPNCDKQVFKCLYDFLHQKLYAEDDSYTHHRNHPSGPPVIVAGRDNPSKNGIITHIRVFKLAESLKFIELQKYALGRLHNMPTTDDNPITALKELYNAVDDEYKDRPIHEHLHKWARDFLKRSDSPASGGSTDYYYDAYGRRIPAENLSPSRSLLSHGTTNYMKLLRVFGDKFEKLYHSNVALKNDVQSVVAQLSAPSLTTTTTGLPLPAPPYSSQPLGPHLRDAWSTPGIADAWNRPTTINAIGNAIYNPPPPLLPPRRIALHPDDYYYDDVRSLPHLAGGLRPDSRVRDRVVLTAESERFRDIYGLNEQV